MISEIVSFLVELVITLGYPGVALAMFIESFFAPVPSEVVLPLAGFIASTGAMNIYVLFIISGISSYAGTLPFYFLGLVGDKQFVSKIVDRFGKFLFIGTKDVEKSFALFEKHGNSLIFFGRLIPIIRSLISIPAGMAHMNFLKFTLYSITGSTIWSIFLVTAGYYFGENWEVVEKIISRYEKFILGTLIIGVLLFFGNKVYKKIRSKDNTADSTE
mgnify:CR=1 FL=1